MISQPVEVASIILYQDQQFMMQLRENIPGILYRGSWVFFGRYVELGESPDIPCQASFFFTIAYSLFPGA